MAAGYFYQTTFFLLFVCVAVCVCMGVCTCVPVLVSVLVENSAPFVTSKVTAGESEKY